MNNTIYRKYRVWLAFAAMLFSLSLFSQNQGRVGINTTTPSTTLDVVAGKPVGATNPSIVTTLDGIQAPRLTRLELTNKTTGTYGTNQTGALIYITDATSGDNLGSRANIDAVGYYYFDGTDWRKFKLANQNDPWYGTTSNSPATTHTQDIYHMGEVGIGRTTANATSPAIVKLRVTPVSPATDPLRLEALKASPTTGQTLLATDATGIIKNTTPQYTTVFRTSGGGLVPIPTINALKLANVTIDTYSGYDSSTGEYTINKGGLYKVIARIKLKAPATPATFSNSFGYVTLSTEVFRTTTGTFTAPEFTTDVIHDGMSGDKYMRLNSVIFLRKNQKIRIRSYQLSVSAYQFDLDDSYIEVVRLF